MCKEIHSYFIHFVFIGIKVKNIIQTTMWYTLTIKAVRIRLPLSSTEKSFIKGKNNNVRIKIDLNKKWPQKCIETIQAFSLFKFNDILLSIDLYSLFF